MPEYVVFVGDGGRIVRWAADPLRLMASLRGAGEGDKRRESRGCRRERWSLSRRSLTSVYALLVSSWLAVVLRVSVDQRCIIDQRDLLVAAASLQTNLSQRRA